MATIDQMGHDAVVIRNETETGANNAERVGQLFVDIVDYLGNLEIDYSSGSGGGGGGGESSSFQAFEPILSINGIGTPSGNNKILLWDGSHWGYTDLPSGGGGGIDQTVLTNFLTGNNPAYDIHYDHIADALSKVNWWGQTINNKAVSGNLTGVGNITMSGQINFGEDIYIKKVNLGTAGSPRWAIEVNGDFYATGGVSALGVNGSGSSSGGEGYTLSGLLQSLDSAGREPSSGDANKVLVWNGSGWVYSPYIAGDSSTFNRADVVDLLEYNPETGEGPINSGWLEFDISDYVTNSGLTSVINNLSNTYYTRQDVDNLLEDYLTIEAFENLFEAQDSSGNKVSHPYESAVDRIKAKFGLWTEQYLSALGISSNSSGYAFDEDAMWDALGDGQNVNNAHIIDSSHIQIGGYSLPSGTPSNGQILKYVNGGWVFSDDATGGGGDTSGLTNDVNILKGKFNTDRSIWGQKYLNGGAFQNIPTNATLSAGSVIASGNVDVVKLDDSTSPSDKKILRIRCGTNADKYEIGYIEREIINNEEQNPYTNLTALSFYPSGIVKAERGLWVSSGSPLINGENNCRCLRIGNGLLSWDEATNSIKVSRYSEEVTTLNGMPQTKYVEQSANLYATGGISALGIPNDPDGSVDSATINNLTSDIVNTKDAVVGKGDEDYTLSYKTKRNESSTETTENLLTHTAYVPANLEGETNAVPEKTVLGNDSIDEVHGKKFFLDAYHYLAYTSEGGVNALRLYSMQFNNGEPTGVYIHQSVNLGAQGT